MIKKEEKQVKRGKNEKSEDIDDLIDLDSYITEELQKGEKYRSEKEIPNELKQSMKKVGIEVDSDKSGIFLQSGNQPDLCISKVQGIELMPVKEALKKYDGTNGKLNLKDYFWKAVARDKDKFTLEAAINEITDGYFIHAFPGQKTIFPLQSCLFIPPLPGLKQIVHNIIIAEPGSQLDIITGCTAHTGAKRAIHLGVSEFYVKENAKVSFTMVHNWTETTKVRPRTGIILEDNARFSNFYVVMSEVKDLQTNPYIQLIGRNSSYFGQTLIYAKGKSYYDTGATAHLIGEGSKAEIISRVLAVDQSHVIARGKIIGDGRGVTGHIDCSALLLSPNSRVDSIPAINAQNPEVTLTHEASVGKISDDHIEYLMSRGLKEDEAVNLIVSGFLDVDTSPLPPSLAEETKKIIDKVAKAEMG